MTTIKTEYLTETIIVEAETDAEARKILAAEKRRIKKDQDARAANRAAAFLDAKKAYYTICEKIDRVMSGKASNWSKREIQPTSHSYAHGFQPFALGYTNKVTYLPCDAGYTAVALDSPSGIVAARTISDGKIYWHAIGFADDGTTENITMPGFLSDLIEKYLFEVQS